MSSRTENFDPVFYRLSGQTRNALLNEGIQRLEDLVNVPPSQLTEIKKIGAKRKEEILDMLDRLDLAPGMNLRTSPDADHPLMTDRIRNLLETIKEKTRHWNQGVEYLKKERVATLRSQNGQVTSRVRGTEMYNVEIDMESPEWECSCPSHDYWGPCKHIIASALYMAERRRLKNLEKEKLDESRLERIVKNLEEDKKDRQEEKSGAIHYVLMKDREGEWRIVAYIGPEDFDKSIRDLSRLQYENIENPSLPADEIDRVILERLSLDYQRNDVLKKTDSPSPMGDVLSLMEDRNLWLSQTGEEKQKLNVSPNSLNLRVHLKSPSDEDRIPGQRIALLLQVKLQNDDLTLSPENVKVICERPLWILHEQTLYRVRGRRNTARLLKEFPSERLRIKKQNVENFCRNIYPSLNRAGVPISFEDEQFETREGDPTGHVFLHEQNRRLIVEFKPAYDGTAVPYGGGNEILLPPGDREAEEASTDRYILLKRNRKKEEQLRDELEETGLRPEKMVESDGPCLTPEEDPLEWLMDDLNDLPEDRFEVFGEEQLEEHQRPISPDETELSVSSNVDWFELEGHVTFDDHQIPLAELREAMENNQRYVKLSDGRRGEIPEEWIEKFSGILEMGREKGEKLQMPSASVPVLDRMLDEVDNSSVDEQFQEARRRFDEFSRIEDVKPPAEFMGDLRPYQLGGLSWLLFLRKHGFGGILADDMGLGKTVQVLALFQKIKEQSGEFPQSLIVAPRSVLNNWDREAQKFVPDLPVYIHHGSSRIKSDREWPTVNGMAVTTYATMRRDVEWLRNITFDYAVLDESQAIRNPETKTSKAARLLEAKHKICLSGTPVQNTTMDLWPQFEFLNPGFLGSQTRFQNTVVKRIEKHGDEEASEWLRKMVDPFMLRRTKDRVEKDLPSLTESKLDCPMGPEQRRVYEEIRRTYRAALEDDDAQSNQELRFKTLEGLTRLRQVCCHPGLVGNESGESAKIKRFRELAREIIQENHRILVFSQFVQFLQRIESVVEEMGWRYEYLDGQTRNRHERVENFQSNDDIPLFLISLKAGGEGLNLTGADYVLLMDPWWNPAVEKQATDRTHRIGQDSRVFVYRLLCPDTIEEKILELQEQKLEMAENIIQPEAGLFKELSREDITYLFDPAE